MPNLESYLPAIWWTLTLVVMFAGLVGTIVPLLPGTTLILAAAVGHHLLLGEAQSVGWWTIAGLTLLTALSYLIDFFSGAMGAKYFGATRWGAIGGILGAVIGIFFGIIGIFIGPLLGALLGELLGGKGILPAGKSGWGTFLGTTAGIVSKLLIAVVMIGWFLAAAIFW